MIEDVQVPLIENEQVIMIMELWVFELTLVMIIHLMKDLMRLNVNLDDLHLLPEINIIYGMLQVGKLDDHGLFGENKMKTHFLRNAFFCLFRG